MPGFPDHAGRCAGDRWCEFPLAGFVRVRQRREAGAEAAAAAAAAVAAATAAAAAAACAVPSGNGIPRAAPGPHGACAGGRSVIRGGGGGASC